MTSLEHLTGCTALTTLCLAGNKLNSLGALLCTARLAPAATFHSRAAADSLPSLPALRELDLTGNAITDVSTLSSLSALTALHTLRLANRDGSGANPGACTCALPRRCRHWRGWRAVTKAPGYAEAIATAAPQLRVLDGKFKLLTEVRRALQHLAPAQPHPSPPACAQRVGDTPTLAANPHLSRADLAGFGVPAPAAWFSGAALRDAEEALAADDGGEGGEWAAAKGAVSAALGAAYDASHKAGVTIARAKAAQ